MIAGVNLLMLSTTTSWSKRTWVQKHSWKIRDTRIIL